MGRRRGIEAGELLFDDAPLPFEAVHLAFQRLGLPLQLLDDQPLAEGFDLPKDCVSLPLEVGNLLLKLSLQGRVVLLDRLHGPAMELKAFLRMD